MWIKTTAKFRPKSISDTEWEMYNKQQQEDACEERDFRFDTEELISYNRGSDPSTTTLDFRHYDGSITVDTPIEELDALFFPKKTKSGAGELLQTNYNACITLRR